MTLGSTVTVVCLYPDLLGTYGDSGNAAILAQRLRWRGQAAEVLTVLSGDTVPASAELYLLGGGEDLPQALAARLLGKNGPLHHALRDGAALLAVCAGLQILGTRFVGPDGIDSSGLELVDCRTVRGPGPRAVGELVVAPDPTLGLPALTGYENHTGITAVGGADRPAGVVRSGVGNGDGTDGVLATRIFGTYLHGPVLARNPALADLLLGWVVGPVAPLDDRESEGLRTERLAVAASQASSSAGPNAGRFRRAGHAVRQAARGRR
ncbi:MAG: type 1 glutamine amidotransferase [Acidimicrobiales bacterium]